MKIYVLMWMMLISTMTFSQNPVKDKISKIRIAASNSCQGDKDMADVVCQGHHDEVTLQKAIEQLKGSGTVELLPGKYVVDGFSMADDGTGYAIRIGYNSSIRIEGVSPNWGGKGAKLVVSEACYGKLSDDVIYSVIGATSGDFGQTMSQNLELSDITVVLPGNGKRIICMDGYNTGRMSAIRCNCFGPKNNRDTDITLGVMDCVGIRGLKGSNNGTASLTMPYRILIMVMNGYGIHRHFLSGHPAAV